MRLFNPFMPSKHLLTKIRFLAVIMGIILTLATFYTVKIAKFAIAQLGFILRNPFLSYDQKMSQYWGGNYRLMKLVRDNTPPTAVIMHPPRVDPWKRRAVGNQSILQYFLYPRGLRWGYRRIFEQDKTITHLLVADDWPKFVVDMRRFHHLPTQRRFLLDGPWVEPGNSAEDSEPPGELLVNYLSHAQKKVNEHRLTKRDDRPLEYFHLTYTLNNYDYWTRTVDIPLRDEITVKAQTRATSRHSIGLIVEVRYNNGKLAIFSSTPNKRTHSWDLLAVTDLYQRAQNYALLKNWDTANMRITRIGIDTGVPRQMPYLEKYGLIELEKGQDREADKTGPVPESGPILLMLGNFYRVKGQWKEAVKQYQLGKTLSPENPWFYYGLGEIFKHRGEYDKAVREYEKTVQLEPALAWFQFSLGQAYQLNKRDDLAIASFKEALELDPSCYWAKEALDQLSVDEEADQRVSSE